MAMRVKFEQRPACSCDAKMKLVGFKSYYEKFNYWRCENCSLDDEMQNYEPEKKESGAYA